MYFGRSVLDYLALSARRARLSRLGSGEAVPLSEALIRREGTFSASSTIVARPPA
jgi:hypothetical protein